MAELFELLVLETLLKITEDCPIIPEMGALLFINEDDAFVLTCFETKAILVKLTEVAFPWATDDEFPGTV